MKISIREIPVTISAFSIGNVGQAKPEGAPFARFMPLNAIAGSGTDHGGDQGCDKNAMIRVLYNACIIWLVLKKRNIPFQR